MSEPKSVNGWTWSEENDGFEFGDWCAMSYVSTDSVVIDNYTTDISVPAPVLAELLRRLGWTVTPPEGK